MKSITEVRKLIVKKFEGKKAQKLPKNLRVLITFASSSFRGALIELRSEA